MWLATVTRDAEAKESRRKAAATKSRKVWLSSGLLGRVDRAVEAFLDLFFSSPAPLSKAVEEPQKNLFSLSKAAEKPLAKLTAKAPSTRMKVLTQIEPRRKKSKNRLICFLKRKRTKKSVPRKPKNLSKTLNYSKNKG